MIYNIIDYCSDIFSNLKFAGVSSVFLASKEADNAELNIPSSGDSLLQLLGLLVLFVIILAACYFVTRWVAKVSSGSTVASNIKIIDTFKIAPSKYVQIIKIAGEYVAIAVSKDSVTFLCKLDEDNINMMPVKPIEIKNFKDILAKVRNKNTDSQDCVEEEVSEEYSEENTSDN